MSSDGALVKRYVEALLEEAERSRVPRDVVGRQLVLEAIELWKRDRDLGDISRELVFISESLDPETDFEFVRP
jgi:hypothetical protein